MVNTDSCEGQKQNSEVFNNIEERKGVLRPGGLRTVCYSFEHLCLGERSRLPKVLGYSKSLVDGNLSHLTLCSLLLDMCAVCAQAHRRPKQDSAF